MEYLLFQDELESSREYSPDASIFVSSNMPNDNDLINIYNFFNYKGYFNIVSIQIINLCTTIFLYLLFLFLVLCIDYQGLIDVKTEEQYFNSYINFSNLLNNNFFYIICNVFMGIYSLIRIHGIVKDILKYKKINNFYKKILKINSKIISSTSWSTILSKLQLLYGKELNEYNVNARILRKENIMCDLFQTKLSNFLFSSFMEWNIYYCIIGCIIDENNKIKEKIFHSKEKIKKELRMNIITISILTFIFMPFLFLYMFFYCILKYGATFYNHPSKIVSRQWSIKAKWSFRYYNELKHILDERLDMGSIYAKEYCSQFNSKVFETFTKFIVFIASSFFMVLLLLSLINEHILFNLNITHDKPIIWYMGILGSIIAIGKNINQERKFGATEETFSKLTNKIKYIPSDLLENNNSLKVKNKLVKFYEYQIFTLLKECLSVLIIPFSLINLLKYIDSIIDFLIKNIEKDNNLGYISKKSNFNNINDSSDIKTLISFNQHRIHYQMG